MAEPIGALRALLSASSAVFEKDMKQARDAVRKNTNDMRSSFEKLQDATNKGVVSGIGKFRKEILTLASVGVLYAATKRAIEFADSIGETAQQLGIGIEAFQEYKYAATQNGVATEDFETSLKKFTRTLGDAKRESSGAVSVFRQLGITQEEIKKMTPEQALARVADRFKDIKDPATKASVAMQLFGKTGLGFTEFLSMGSAAIDIFRQRARDLGIVLSADMVKKAMVANDQLDEMGMIFKVAGANIALQFMPAIQEFAKLVTDPAFIHAIGQFAELLRKGMEVIRKYYPEIIGLTVAFYGFGAAVKYAKGNQYAMLAVLASSLGLYAYLRYQKNTRDAKAATEEFGDSTGETTGTLEGFGDELNLSTVDLGKMTKELNDANSALTELMRISSDRRRVGIQVGDSGPMWNDQAKSFTEYFNRTQDMYDVIAQAAQQNINLSTEAGNRWAEAALKNRSLSRALSDQQRVLEEIQTPIQAYREDVNRLNELLEQGYITQDQYNRALVIAKENFAGNTKNLRGLAAAGKEMGDQLNSVLGDLITNTEEWDQVLMRALSNMAKAVLQKSILDPITSTLSTGFSNFLGGIKFGGARAEGGRTSAGRTYLVGENGPELRTDLGTGTIVPNNELGSMGGNHYYIDASGADEGTLRRLEMVMNKLAGPGVTERRAKEAMLRGK